MAKLIAIVNVVAWSGFWAFGYLAFSGDPANAWQMVTAAILAFVGAAIGALAYFWLVRHSEATGYARRPNQVPREHERATLGDQA
ncbi:MAG: SNARE associated Golgi protein [Rhodobacteraceae bacterium HLUCCA08]|nr:MAG: SNARE associated Golgi protein [Rhodobacteraceae bacterium HLUCCA08]